ncbi:hypothetical protein ACRCUN_33455 [Mycobacterium sp. LTG2003]
MCEDAIEGVSNFLSDSPYLIAIPIVGTWANWIGDWGNDPSQVDNDDLHAPTTGLDDLNRQRYEKASYPVVPENFVHVTFDEVSDHLTGPRIGGMGTGLAAAWGALRDAIATATDDFENALESLVKDKEHWNGDTKGAAFENVRASFREPTQVSLGAGAMETLLDGFTRTMDFVYDNIAPNREKYQHDLANYSGSGDEIKHAYDTFAQKVMNETYRPNIETIANNNPSFTGGGPPDLGNNPGGPAGPGSLGGGGGAPSGGPQTPDLGLPEIPDPTIPTDVASPTTSPNLDGIADAAKNALGQMGDAAKQAADAAKEAFQPPTGDEGPPEGVLGLGPTGIGTTKPPLGGAGGPKAGGGSGIGMPRAIPNAKAVSGIPVPAAARMAAPAVGAGLGAMGAPGTGAPAAAQRGDNNAKGHQVNKALKRKKNGQELVGDTDAIVPVIGADESAETTESERGAPAWPKPPGEAPRPSRGQEDPDRPFQLVSQ